MPTVGRVEKLPVFSVVGIVAYLRPNSPVFPVFWRLEVAKCVVSCYGKFKKSKCLGGQWQSGVFIIERICYPCRTS